MAPLNLTDLRPDRTIDPAGLDAARDLLHARIEADATPTTVVHLTSRRRRGAVRLGLVGAAAAAAAVVTLVLPNPTDAAAFAGWTAVPAQLDAADTAAAGEQCLALRTDLAGDAPQGDPPVNLAGARTVLADRRGETTFTVLASDAGLQSCLIGPAVATSLVLSGSGDVVLGSGSGDASDAPREQLSVGVVGDDETPAADGATYAAGGIDGVGSDEPWGFAVGRVGADVTSVEVRLADGSTVQASVAEGVWAAWWPTQQLAAGVVPTLADGTVGQSPAIDRSTLEVTSVDGTEDADASTGSGTGGGATVDDESVVDESVVESTPESGD
ncbi:hypothetical protein [Cellulomonas persica]|uniref:Uncharacterized protein n=1 Tax=Cellulomonas persica TaxID=76861 RepID=A0A510UWQ8_9CELL|nr:hypothetical protein [Cellulomonas persica]GEK17510.1 hypothetical protein CPE01_12430 [Cellulomonas persica]